ncbi:Protein of unknown function DUF1664, partial [Cynara cardunculus var. scolymus]
DETTAFHTYGVIVVAFGTNLSPSSDQNEGFLQISTAAMAMQAGMGFSKIIILVGAGYTGTLMLKNGKLSDVLGELQVRRLAMEVRQMASSRQITVLNGGSSGNVTSLVVPVATLGAVGYGYMWWKCVELDNIFLLMCIQGFSFSDLMYVTKQNMATAVSNLTKHLEQVSDALAAAKKHLTQRIENLDGKLDQQVEISKLIKSEVTDVRDDLSQIGYDLDSLNRMVSGLNGKIMTLEEKQDLTNLGVWYLCNKADGNKISGKAQSQVGLIPNPTEVSMAGTEKEKRIRGSRDLVREQEQFRLAGKSFAGYLTSGGMLNLEGVKEIADTLDSDDGSLGSDKQPRRLTRKNTVKFSS